MVGLPDRLKVGVFDYEVESWDSPAAEAAQCYGKCSMLELKIRVAENLAPQHQAETLLHETLHAVFQQQCIIEDNDLSRSVWPPSCATTLAP